MWVVNDPAYQNIFALNFSLSIFFKHGYETNQHVASSLLSTAKHNVSKNRQNLQKLQVQHFLFSNKRMLRGFP